MQLNFYSTWFDFMWQCESEYFSLIQAFVQKKQKMNHSCQLLSVLLPFRLHSYWAVIRLVNKSVWGDLSYPGRSDVNGTAQNTHINTEQRICSYLVLTWVLDDSNTNGQISLSQFTLSIKVHSHIRLWVATCDQISHPHSICKKHLHLSICKFKCILSFTDRITVAVNTLGQTDMLFTQRKQSLLYNICQGYKKAQISVSQNSYFL